VRRLEEIGKKPVNQVIAGIGQLTQLLANELASPSG
jgi:hypothetical protein